MSIVPTDPDNERLLRSENEVLRSQLSAAQKRAEDLTNSYECACKTEAAYKEQLTASEIARQEIGRHYHEVLDWLNRLLVECGGLPVKALSTPTPSDYVKKEGVRKIVEALREAASYGREADDPTIKDALTLAEKMGL